MSVAAALARAVHVCEAEAPGQHDLACAQAFQSIGGLLVAGAYSLAVTFAETFPIIRGGHQAWRYTLLSGMAPALLLLLWIERHGAAQTDRQSSMLASRGS